MKSSLPTPDLWVSRPKPNPSASIRLFCMPCAGGSPQMYFQWPDHLPPDVEVCAICPPGHMRRLFEPPLTKMDAMVSTLLANIQQHLDRPFALFGHSMGALVCFEFARSLNGAQSSNLRHLFVSGCYAPHLEDPHPISNLPDAELIAELRRLGGMPKEVLAHAELLELCLPALRADLILTEQYRPFRSSPLRCPITALFANRDPFADRSQVVPWEQHTSLEFRCQEFDGDHFFIQSLQEDCLRVVSEGLSRQPSRLPDASRWRGNLPESTNSTVPSKER